MTAMRVAVIGSGGREHALRHVLSRTATVVDPSDDADLYVIGPEQPLVDGVADELRAGGKLVFGPGADGARLEGSKSFMKQMAAAAGIPTARHGTFTDVGAAAAFLRTLPGLYVVKTDYLAGGKGVLVTESLPEALDDVRAKLEHGAVVIEEGMTGPELSLLCVCDGRRSVSLEPARDHKRVGDGDTGPNTGGMGAFSPVPDAPGSGELNELFGERMLRHLRAEGTDYRGVLYAGLMLTPHGPKLVEYNVRFGDPEAQAVLPRLVSDLAELLAGAAAGHVPAGAEPVFTPDACVTVVLAAAGYPQAPRTGDPIEGLDEAEAVEGVTVFHAAVAVDDAGRPVTAGGRVLAVTGLGPDLVAARARAYEGIAHISWPGMHHRTDIAATAARASGART